MMGRAAMAAGEAGWERLLVEWTDLRNTAPSDSAGRDIVAVHTDSAIGRKDFARMSRVPTASMYRNLRRRHAYANTSLPGLVFIECR